MLKLNLTTPAPLPGGRLEISRLGDEKRADIWLARFRDAAELEGDFEDIRRELKAALTQSEVSIRVRDPDARNGWSYELRADSTTRIAAARLLLAYLAGLPPSQADVRRTPAGSSPGDRDDVAAQLQELRSIGVGMQELVDHLQRKSERVVNVETRTETEAP